jgi:hypothetical protein
MRIIRPRLSAVLAVLLSTAVGAVTNLITTRWSWTLIATLAALLLASCTLAAHAALVARKPGTAEVFQVAKGRSQIHDSAIRHAGRGIVRQTARRRGTILRSRIDGKNGNTTQTASNGSITDSPIGTQK